ncbi:MAG TPA: proline dehydrogenase family protein [Candidatus Eisenbacteria bacterium]|nr:proline dehydrogenase family protein [Candidatus Eisenbacteria bacterium]
MLRRVFLWASENEWCRRRLPRYGFVRSAVKRFMPGEDVASALAATTSLNASGMGTVLTLLGENVRDQADTAAVVKHYIEVMEAIATQRLDAEVSVKLTHLGLDLAPGIAEANLKRIASRAAELGQDVAVDMEGSPYTERTLALFRCVRAAHPNVGLCLQAYLKRTPADLESLLPLHPMIRLVKGAYAEPEAIAYPGKADVDAQFVKLAHRLLEAKQAAPGTRVIFGTHDRRLIADLQRWAESRGIARDGYEFHLLYGIGRDDQLQLARAGYHVRVLISYGAAWFPWYMRRLAERPANVWFVVKSLFAR